MNLAAKTLAAAWREDLGRARTGAGLHYTATERDCNRLDIADGPRIDGRDADPLDVLTAILDTPVPDRLAAELHSAAANTAIAAERAERRTHHLTALARRTGTTSLATLIARTTRDIDTTARLLETLATDGHPLHPCARTRLGWTPDDTRAYDLETPVPVHLNLIADTAGILAASGTDLRTHPMLTGLDLPHPVLPVHPWQLRERLRTRHRHLFDDGDLTLLPHTVPAWPTASIRTLAGHHRPGYLKVALAVHITSTRRDISPATAMLAPHLTALLAKRVTDSRHTVLTDTAGVWLPGSRDCTAIARTGLADTAPPGTVVVPGTALTATSPVTGTALAAEYARWSGDPDAWIRDYADLTVPPILRLAARGIGLEAHLQNTLIAFAGPRPVRLITRDLGGARIIPAVLPDGLRLPEDSPVAAAGPETVRAKVAHSLIVNHLAPLTAALERDLGLDTAAFWADLADQIAGLDLPAADRDTYLARRLPAKALLTMRLADTGDRYRPVDNPLARARR